MAHLRSPLAFTLLGLGLALAIGVAAGVGGFTFAYAKGASYLQDDPAACANCHVMNEQYASWQQSSHHTVAVCNDCHTPHSFVGKYASKALNGWHHSVAFTSGDFVEPIRIGPRNRAVTEAACRSCHPSIVQDVSAHAGPAEGGLSCIRCHRTVGHAP